MGEPDGESDSVRNYYFFSSAMEHFVSFLIRMKYRKREGERAGRETERKKEEERVETKQEEKIEK